MILTHSLTHSLTHLLTHSLTHSLYYTLAEEGPGVLFRGGRTEQRGEVVDWLMGWEIGCLVAQSAGWLVAWSVGCLLGRLPGRLVSWLVEAYTHACIGISSAALRHQVRRRHAQKVEADVQLQKVGRLVDWSLVGCLFFWSVGRSVGWLAGWLAGWLVGWLCILPTIANTSLPWTRPRFGVCLMSSCTKTPGP